MKDLTGIDITKTFDSEERTTAHLKINGGEIVGTLMHNATIELAAALLCAAWGLPMSAVHAVAGDIADAKKIHDETKTTKGGRRARKN